MRNVDHVSDADPAMIRACSKYINHRLWGRTEKAEAVRGPDGQRLTWASVPADYQRDVELVVDDALEWVAQQIEKAREDA